MLYVADGSGQIIAYEAVGGSVKWTSARIGDILSAPTITADSVYIGVNLNGVVALSVANGAQTAKLATDSEVFASPVIDGGVVYAGCQSGSLYAFDLATGQQKWRFAAGARCMAIRRWPTAVDAAAGQEKWRATAIGEMWSPVPAVSGGVVYASDGDSMRAIDAASSSERWSYRQVGTNIAWTSAAVTNGLVIAGTTDKKLTALGASSGAVAWQITLFNTSEVIAAEGLLCGGTADFGPSRNPTAPQKFYAIDALNGAVLWTFDTDGEVSTGGSIGDGKVFFFTQNRTLYALE